MCKNNQQSLHVQIPDASLLQYVYVLVYSHTFALSTSFLSQGMFEQEALL